MNASKIFKKKHWHFWCKFRLPADFKNFKISMRLTNQNCFYSMDINVNNFPSKKLSFDYTQNYFKILSIQFLSFRIFTT